MVNTSRKFRLGNKVMIDEDEILEMIDQLRAAIPDEIAQAKRMLAERERILDTAQIEAGRVVERAQENAGRLVDDQKLVVEARAQADRILAEANSAAEGLKEDADEYVAQVLRGLEGMLSSSLSHVRNGLAQLDGDRTRVAR